jgi:hypothetical protein
MEKRFPTRYSHIFISTSIILIPARYFIFSCIEFTYTTEDKIPSWYQYYTCANKNMRIPGWEPFFHVRAGTYQYSKYLKEKQNESNL